MWADMLSELRSPETPSSSACVRRPHHKFQWCWVRGIKGILAQIVVTSETRGGRRVYVFSAKSGNIMLAAEQLTLPQLSSHQHISQCFSSCPRNWTWTENQGHFPVKLVATGQLSQVAATIFRNSYQFIQRRKAFLCWKRLCTLEAVNTTKNQVRV